MKKFLSFKILLFILLNLLPVNLLAERLTDNEKYFIVTAYYSPLPNQQSYITGNYRSEKILNGEGIRGASGKKVFSGMLAAPSKYSFGTKIYLEGLGIGSVEDRGGAIVPAGKRGYQYDRIDIWVGYGDEGLKRAMHWGKRKVKGKVLLNNPSTNLDYKTIPSPGWTVKTITPEFNIFNNSIGKNSNIKNIKKLQDFLLEVGLYKGEVDGIYSTQIIDIIYNFQIKNSIIKDEYTYGAGYWGKTTRSVMKKQYKEGLFDNKDLIIDNNLKENEFDIFNSPLEGIENTKEVQEILQRLGFYKGEIDGVYSSIKDVILKYQINNNIIKNDLEVGAGYFGPQTREGLKEDYIIHIENEKVKLLVEEKIEKVKEESLDKANKRIEILGTPKYGEISTNVRELQLVLKELGHFQYKDTAIFGAKTKNSIIEFQIKNKILSSENQVGAGVVGPKTRNLLINVLKEKIFIEELSKSGLKDELEQLTKKEDTENKNEFSVEYLQVIKI